MVFVLAPITANQGRTIAPNIGRVTSHPGTIKHNPIHIRRIPIDKLYKRIRDKRSLSGLDTDVTLFVKIRIVS